MNECGLVGENVSLGVDFGILNAQARPSVFLLFLSADLDVVHSATPSMVCLFATVLPAMALMSKTSKL